MQHARVHPRTRIEHRHSNLRAMSSRALPLSALALVVAIGAAACERERAAPSSPSFEGDVEALLQAQCARCHADSALGGFRTSSYVEVIGCLADGRPTITPPPGGGAPPLLAALDRPDHSGLVTPSQREAIAAWIAAGAPRSRGGAHATGFADPRSPESHGRALRASGYRPMLDASDDDACGACHDGVASRRPEIAFGAPGAPSCTTCHVESGGALACSTCHGSGTRAALSSLTSRAYPPQDACFFEDARPDRDHGAHAAHAGPSPSRAAGLPCSTCHPSPEPGSLAAPHADGYVEVWFDYAVAGRGAAFDATNGRCTETCHARGGPRPAPTWRGEAPMTCNDCHASPPPSHYQGPCTSCHAEADAHGTSLTSPTLHANGKVDLGDGSGGCGACHGTGDDPWPKTGAHAAHAAPTSAKSVPCATCHAVPSAGERHPVAAGAAKVRLAGLAVRGGSQATYDPVNKTCAATYCHDGAGGTRPAPRWLDAPPTTTCGSCHAIPPPPPHAQVTTCAGGMCHDGIVETGAITVAGRARHVDGVVDRHAP